MRQRLSRTHSPSDLTTFRLPHRSHSCRAIIVVSENWSYRLIWLKTSYRLVRPTSFKTTLAPLRDVEIANQVASVTTPVVGDETTNLQVVIFGHPPRHGDVPPVSPPLTSEFESWGEWLRTFGRCKGHSLANRTNRLLILSSNPQLVLLSTEDGGVEVFCNRRTGEFYTVTTESGNDDDDYGDDDDDAALLENASRLAHSV